MEGPKTKPAAVIYNGRILKGCESDEMYPEAKEAFEALQNGEKPKVNGVRFGKAPRAPELAERRKLLAAKVRSAGVRNAAGLALKAVAMLLLIFSLANAQSPKVRYDVQTLKANRLAEPISEVTVGQEFDLALLCQDLREPGIYEYAGEERELVRGVYAAYCDVVWDKSKVAVKLAPTPNARLRFFNAFLFAPEYRSGPQAIEAPDGFMRTGAFRGLSFGGDTEPHEFVRCRMVATGMGRVVFETKLTRLRPGDDTLVYGNLAANPAEQSWVQPSEIVLGRCLLNVK